MCEASVSNVIVTFFGKRYRKMDSRQPQLDAIVNTLDPAPEQALNIAKAQQFAYCS